MSQNRFRGSRDPVHCCPSDFRPSFMQDRHEETMSHNLFAENFWVWLAELCYRYWATFGVSEWLMALFLCMVRHGTVQYVSLLGGFHWVQYLVLFLGPPLPRFQASRTVTKMWRVNSADHWLAGENSHCLHHWTWRHDTQNRPARFKSAQPAKDQTQLFWMSTPFF